MYLHLTAVEIEDIVKRNLSERGLNIEKIEVSYDRGFDGESIFDGFNCEIQLDLPGK